MAKRQPTALSSAFVDLFGGGGDSRTPPSEFRIFASGVNKTTKGDFLFDGQAAEAVMSAYRQHAVDLTIDYDHHTLAAASGVKAVSAGWFNLAMRDGELWATNVRWTPVAEEHFRNREYRYFSPLFDAEKSTGRIVNLINNALTNTPAMDGIEALVAASQHQGDSTMTEEQIKDLQTRLGQLERGIAERDSQIAALKGQTVTVALATAVGLSATAQDAEVRTVVTGLVNFRKQVLDTLEKKDEATAIGALSALKEKAGEAAALTARIAEIEQAALSQEWKTYLDGLTVTGKDGKFLEPAKRDKAEKMALTIGGGALTRKGIDGAKEYVVEMLSARTGGQFTPVPGGVGLDATTMKILQVQGVDPAKFSEFETKRLAAGGR